MGEIMSDGKRYYWLKLKKDFFKRHDIKILKGMKDGQRIILVYLELMTESLDHNGELRFNEKISYTPEMLSRVIDEDEDFVKYAIDCLMQFDLLEQDENGTFILPKVESMIGSAADNDHAKRQQRYRDRLKDAQSDASVTDSVTKSDASVTQSCTKSDESKRKRKSKSKTKESKEKHAHGSLQNVLLTDEEYDRLKAEYGAEADEAIEHLSLYMKEKAYKTKDHNLTIRRWVIDAIREKKGKGKTERVKPKPNTMTQMMTNPMSDSDLEELEKRLTVNG